MRFHGTTPREPWEFGDEAVAIYKKYAWLRESLLPYIISSARKANESGLSIMRPMAMAFPQARIPATCDDQYMFGDDLLVAPMVRSGTTRAVQLPPGVWTDFWTGEELAGDRKIEFPLPLNKIGVFLRAGAAVPLDLAVSLVAGESMSKGRVRAILATRPVSGDRWRVDTAGVQFLIRYVSGKRNVTALNGRDEWLEGPEQ
jgi:alpha-glucosidase (family GH31 glycosyl hydrolase)